MIKFKCPNCNSDKIQEKRWVDINTGEVKDIIDEGYWCDNCESHLKGIVEYPDYTDDVIKQLSVDLQINDITAIHEMFNKLIEIDPVKVNKIMKAFLPEKE